MQRIHDERRGHRTSGDLGGPTARGGPRGLRPVRGEGSGGVPRNRGLRSARRAVTERADRRDASVLAAFETRLRRALELLDAPDSAFNIAERAIAEMVPDAEMNTQLLPTLQRLLKDKDALSSMRQAMQIIATPDASLAIAKQLHDLVLPSASEGNRRENKPC